MENSQQIESTTSSNVKKNQLNSKQQKQLEDFKEYCLQAGIYSPPDADTIDISVKKILKNTQSENLEIIESAPQKKIFSAACQQNLEEIANYIKSKYLTSESFHISGIDIYTEISQEEKDRLLKNFGTIEATPQKIIPNSLEITPQKIIPIKKKEKTPAKLENLKPMETCDILTADTVSIREATIQNSLSPSFEPSSKQRPKLNNYQKNANNIHKAEDNSITYLHEDKLIENSSGSNEFKKDSSKLKKLQYVACVFFLFCLMICCFFLSYITWEEYKNNDYIVYKKAKNMYEFMQTEEEKIIYHHFQEKKWQPIINYYTSLKNFQHTSVSHFFIGYSYYQLNQNLKALLHLQSFEIDDIPEPEKKMLFEVLISLFQKYSTELEKLYNIYSKYTMCYEDYPIEYNKIMAELSAKIQNFDVSVEHYNIYFEHKKTEINDPNIINQYLKIQQFFPLQKNNLCQYREIYYVDETEIIQKYAYYYIHSSNNNLYSVVTSNLRKPHQIWSLDNKFYYKNSEKILPKTLHWSQQWERTSEGEGATSKITNYFIPIKIENNEYYCIEVITTFNNDPNYMYKEYYSHLLGEILSEYYFQNKMYFRRELYSFKKNVQESF